MTEQTNRALRSALYARCSDPRQDTSVEDQLAWAQDVTRRSGLTIVRTFTDEGVPGSEIDTRPGLMAMLAYLEACAGRGDPLDALLVWDMDRFSRANSLRTAGTLAQLMEAGVSRTLAAA